MAHCIHGFIAAHGALVAAAHALPSARVCPLDRGFGFLPVTEDMAPPDSPASDHPFVVRLTAPLATFAAEQSAHGPIAYVETDYFGGVGSQCAVVWRDGAVVLGPLETTDEDGNTTPLLEGAINRALRLLGVQRGSVRDEFEALGLGRHRDNEDWVATLSSEPAHPTGAKRRR